MMENKPKSTKCVNCEKRVKDWHEVESKNYCQECFDELFSTCDDCGEFAERDYIYTTHSGNIICQTCLDDSYFTCDDCNEIYHNDNCNDINDGNRYVCNDCIGEYTYCEDCNTNVSNDNGTYCDTCDYSICNSCYESGEHYHEEEGENREVVPTFFEGKRPSRVRYNRFVGIEFEAIDGDRQDLESGLSTNCGLTDDGSLGSSGVEVQTPPSSLNHLENFVKEVTKSLKQSGYKIDTTCGLHAHIDARDFKNKPKVLSRVLKTLYAIEDIIFSIQPSSRWNNTYCQRLTRNYAYKDFKVANLDKLEERWYKTGDKEYINRAKKIKYENTRYNGLNLHSLFYRGTLEFRHHSGTLNPIKVLNWVNLILTIVNYSLRKYKEKEVIRLLNTPFTPKKIDLFFKTFGISQPLQTYIGSRVAKFNPSYNFYPNSSREED